MDRRLAVLWHPTTLVLFGALFALATLLLRSATCIEGGTVVGFPWYFYAQCYAVFPGGPLDPAIVLPTMLVLDLAVWYALAVVIVLVARRATHA